jgi:Undecaprenyl-phosphate galactose phosphotransferase WbaP
VKGQTATSGSEMGSVALGGAVGQGLFQSHKRYAPTAESTMESAEDSRRNIALNFRPFSRRVGVRYSIQVLINSLPLLLVDVVALTATIAACRFLFFQINIRDGMDVSAYLLPIAAGFVLLNFNFGLYPGVRLSPVEELRRLVASVTCIFVFWAVCVITIVSLAPGINRLYLPVVYAACLLILPIARSWARHILGKWTNWGIPVLVCGDDLAAVRLYNWLSDNHHLGFRPVGVIGDRDGLGAGPEDAWYAGPWSEAPEIADKRQVFWTVVVPPEGKSSTIPALITDYLYTIPQVHVLTELTGLPDHWNPQRLDGLAGIQLQQNLMLPLPRLTKRLMDMFGAIFGGILLLPLLFYLAVAVKMSSRGPIFYGHERIGRYGRRFKAWKFRTMFQDANLVLDQYLEDNPEAKDEWERDHKLKYDPRITRIGRFLRKTSLDEVPQLWNVILGDMSLVGPRPIVTKEIEKYGPYFSLYTMVKPGITGLWQVSGRNNTTYDERVQLDAYYVRNWSPWMDAFLLIKTIRIVLFARGAY